MPLTHGSPLAESLLQLLLRWPHEWWRRLPDGNAGVDAGGPHRRPCLLLHHVVASSWLSKGVPPLPGRPNSPWAFQISMGVLALQEHLSSSRASEFSSLDVILPHATENLRVSKGVPYLQGRLHLPMSDPKQQLHPLGLLELRYWDLPVFQESLTSSGTSLLGKGDPAFLGHHRSESSPSQRVLYKGSEAHGSHPRGHPASGPWKVMLSSVLQWARPNESPGETP